MSAHAAVQTVLQTVQEKYIVKKAFLGMFLSLLLAGAISAAADIASVPPRGMGVMIGEGTLPLPLVAVAPNEVSDVASPNR